MPIVNGTLTDFGLDPLTTNSPELLFRASSTGLSGLNLLSMRKPVEVIPAANGYFEADLVATTLISPETTHDTGEIRYREDRSGRLISEVLPWKLLVPPEGGALGDLLRVPANPALVWTGEQPPILPSPGTWWLDPTTGDLREMMYDGSTWDYKANLRGPQGYNATGAAEDAAALAAFTSQTAGPNAFATALDQVLLGLHGKSKGGAITKSRRKPTLHIEREWPNTRSDYMILWADGETVYAEGRDATLRKSTDGGRTWTAKTFNFSLSNYRGMFLKVASGALLQVRNNTPLQFYRSTDDGATWTAGTQCRASGIFLTAQSWAQDPNTGYIYAVEYHTSDATFADVRVYRSTDDGVTFSVWYTFPGPTSSDPKKIRHGHSVQWDSVSQRIYVSMGDADNAAGIYRVTADGSTLEAVVTREMLAAAGIVAVPNLARAIGIMWFSEYIAWGVDEPDGEIVRMKRTEIGKAAPVIERGLGLTSGGWGCVKASADGSTWLTFGSAEQDGGIALDRAMHVYAVSDQGKRVIEVGSIPAAGQPFSAPAAVGQAEVHTDVMWFRTRGVDQNGAVDRFYKAQLGVGEVQVGSTNSAQPLYYGAPVTMSGRGTVGIYSTGTPNGYTLGYTRAPLTARRLYIIDGGVHSFSGTVRIRAYRKDTNAVVFSSTAKTARGGISRLEASEYLTATQVPGDTDIEFRLEDNTGAAVGEGSGYVTFAWGM